MTLLRSAAMAFLMFSRVPMPLVEWKKDNMRYMLAMFPLVGVLEGVLLLLWTRLSFLLNFGSAVFAAGMTVIPVLYTGAIHTDGYCDTIDAISSRAAPERKREILKDTHIGAFAAIYCVIYFLAKYSVLSEISRDEPTILLICLVPVISRVFSGFAGTIFPTSGNTGLLAAFHDGAEKRPAMIILLFWLLLAGAALMMLSAIDGAAMLLLAFICAACVYFMSKKQFGGMSGDLSGFLLEISELSMLVGILFVEKVGNLF